MNVRFYSLPPGQTPTLTRIIGLVASALLGTIALIVGGLFFIIVLGVSMVGAAFLYARMWWIKRKLARNGHTTQRARGQSSNQAPPRGAGGHVIDAEYTVVRDHEHHS